MRMWRIWPRKVNHVFKYFLLQQEFFNKKSGETEEIKDICVMETSKKMQSMKCGKQFKVN